ncbi:head-tail adaptor protein [Streptomyces ovatisporus]|uniref:Head-tail adaptor protein n=1 Tax=Streptomyces ovatisporus TaxID=1128682 RepID=A0ABV9A2A9_9ACTN
MSRVSRLLNSTVEIWREQRVDDGGGGWETSWSLLASVRARLSQPSAGDRQAALQAQADQAMSRLTHVVYIEPGTDVRFGDQLRRAGLTLLVLSVYEPSGAGTYLRLDCTARQPDTGGV